MFIFVIEMAKYPKHISKKLLAFISESEIIEFSSRYGYDTDVLKNILSGKYDYNAKIPCQMLMLRECLYIIKERVKEFGKSINPENLKI